MTQEPKDQIEGGWRAWHGGLMPVPSYTAVEVMMAGQDKPELPTQALNWCWAWKYDGECGGDIVAWRLMQDPQESEELEKAAKLAHEQQAEIARLQFAVECLEKDLAHLRGLVPDTLYPASKDWAQGCTAERIEWLIGGYEGGKQEIERLTKSLGEVLAHRRSHTPDGCMASVKWHNEGEAEHTRRLMGITRELARQL